MTFSEWFKETVFFESACDSGQSNLECRCVARCEAMLSPRMLVKISYKETRRMLLTSAKSAPEGPESLVTLLQHLACGGPLNAANFSQNRTRRVA